jgi:hypothetical protein
VTALPWEPATVHAGGMTELVGTRSRGSGPPTATFSESWWENAIWSCRLVDMVNGTPFLYDTSVACVATTDGLRIGFRVEDPFPTAHLTERDSLVFQENDVEFFLDFGHGYYEFELNAAGTIYEVLHVWRDTFAETRFATDPAFDLNLPGAFTFGGDHDRKPATFWTGIHPRGPRNSFLHYDLPGLQTAVVLYGKLNDQTEVSAGWTAEVLLPWDGLGDLSPTLGAHTNSFSIGFMRFQQVTISGATTTAAVSLTPHGVLESHLPERFTRVTLPPR